MHDIQFLFGASPSKVARLLADPFFGKGVRRSSNLTILNPGHTTGGSGGSGGAAHRGAAGRCGAGWDGTPTGRSTQDTTAPPAPQGTEDNCLERLFGSTNKRNPS